MSNSSTKSSKSIFSSYLWTESRSVLPNLSLVMEFPENVFLISFLKKNFLATDGACFCINIENPYKILWGCRTCESRVKTVGTNSRTTFSDFSLLVVAGSEISDRHADSALTFEPAAGQGICLWPNTEPILKNPNCWAQL